MKAIICFAKGNLHIHTFSTEWTVCSCGSTKAKWINPDAGTVVVASKDRSKVKLLGMNNAYLIPACTQGYLTWSEYQLLHENAVDAPGYLFNKDKVCCWAAIVDIGRSNDVRWATDEEYVEAFP